MCEGYWYRYLKIFWYRYQFTKKRNQLKIDTVEKIVYIYLNSALLDDIDNKDYFEEEYGEPDEE
jgi:hypothetical protein